MKKSIQLSPGTSLGPYSPALLSDNRLYISGQVAMDSRSGELFKGPVDQQCRIIMENIGLLLKTAGMDYGDLVSCRIYLSSMDDFAAINTVYQSFLSEPYPARATIEVSRLPRDMDVEIEAIAEKIR